MINAKQLKRRGALVQQEVRTGADLSSGRGVGLGRVVRRRLLLSDFNTFTSPSSPAYSFTTAPPRWGRPSKHARISPIRSLVGIEEDFQIMADIAAGEPAALGRLYERYGGTVYAICLRILGNHSDAEDCLVNIFWEIWNRSGRYDAHRSAPLTYITTIARCRAIDRRRSNAVHSHPGVSLDAGREQSFSASIPAHTPDPASKTMLDEVRTQLQVAMQSLDPLHRQMIECSYFDGMSHSQIAQKLGKPLGSVKSGIRQGLMQMRKTLRNE